MRIVQSNTHKCFVCGIDNTYGLKITFESNGEGVVTARKIFSTTYQGYPGIVHGGVIAAVLDEVAGRATMKSKRPDVSMVTGKLSIRYRKPVRVNEEVMIEGKMISKSGRVYQCTSNMRSTSGELLAEADVTLVEPDDELVTAITTADDQWIDYDEKEAENDR